MERKRITDIVTAPGNDQALPTVLTNQQALEQLIGFNWVRPMADWTDVRMSFEGGSIHQQ